jgi:hypothetical protein
MGQIKGYKNAILNSRFDADNSYPIYDASLLFDNNFSIAGDCQGSNGCKILTNYSHNSPLIYEPSPYQHTFANRTFHSINSPYNILDIGHEIQPRLLKMFGVGTYLFDLPVSPWPTRYYNAGSYLFTIANTIDFNPTFSQSWVKCGVEQSVLIPTWASKIIYGVKYLAKSDDLFRNNNFGGLKLNFRQNYIFRNYVNLHIIRRSSASAVDTLESLYGSNIYTYFMADEGINAMSQWLGPDTSRVKVRKRSSTIIDNNADKFIKIYDKVDIPTFNDSSAEPDLGNGRPETVSLEMFFAEWCSNLNDDDVTSGSIYFYEPFIYFE